MLKNISLYYHLVIEVTINNPDPMNKESTKENADKMKTSEWADQLTKDGQGLPGLEGLTGIRTEHVVPHTGNKEQKLSFDKLFILILVFTSLSMQF